MYNPTYTTDVRRIARLMFNAEEGALRERLPFEERMQMDLNATIVSSEKLARLFENASYHARSARLERADGLLQLLQALR